MSNKLKTLVMYRNNTELRECPFCGSENIRLYGDDENSYWCLGTECLNTRQKDSMDEERFIHNFNVCHNKKSYDFQGCPDDFECTKDYTFLAVCDEVSDHYPCKECWKNFLRGEKC